MLYNLKSEIDKTKARKRFSELIEKDTIIELKEKRRRGSQQNRYLHLILGWYGLEYGCSMDYVKLEYFKKLVNKDLFIFQKEVKNGKTIEEIKSSADLDSVEMTEAIDCFRNWSSSDNGGNIYLPSPNEQSFLDEIEVLISQNNY
jgi:hypothetical protein